MTREGALAVMIGVAVLLLAALALAWWRRSRRDSVLVPPFGEAPPEATVTATYHGLYVATTAHDQPLERLAIPGLGFRSRLALTVTDLGLGLDLPGSTTVFIPAERLLDADQSALAIDRVVERDGLVRVVWLLDGGRIVDSYLRPQDVSARIVTDSIRSLIPSGSDA